jgi:hypothetical protein
VIATAALEVVAILVVEGHQIELACPEVLGVKVASGVPDAAVVDGIRVWIGKERILSTTVRD